MVMKINLQFFGGRGSSSGLDKLRQVTVDMNGTKITYRSERGKTYKVGLANTVSVTDEVPKTLKEIVNRAKKLGYPIKTYTNREYAQYEKEYREERKKASEQLDILWNEVGPRPRKGWRGH